MSSPLESWFEEKQSAYLYRILSELEKSSEKNNDRRREKLFHKMAEAAEKQAEMWRQKMTSAPPPFEPKARIRLVGFLIRKMGPRFVKQALAASKVRGLSIYSLSNLGHEIPTSATVHETRHRANSKSGNLRAAVFGMNDGLVSNASLIMGFAGAVSENHVILLSGVAGLLAGAFSMAAGEFISVKSQRELFEYQIALEKEELEEYPQEEALELALIYEAKGISAVDAKRVAEQLISDPAKALDTLAREELGLNPDELGSPIGAAVFSFLSFAMGAFVPLFPYLFLQGDFALRVSASLTVLALFCVGASLSLFTGKSALVGGTRMVLIGSGAALMTYLIGHFMRGSIG